MTNHPVILANRYALQLAPRIGGMAKVYPASDISEAGKKVAVKMFERGTLNEEIISEAFSRELRALKELQHPAIVQLLDWGNDQLSGRPFLVRIGRSDNPRIAPEIGALLLENQIDGWRDDAILRGHRFLEKYAQENGFSLQQLKVGEQLNRLSVLTRELSNLDTESARRESERKEFLQADPLILQGGGRASRDQGEEITQMSEDLERLKLERGAKEKERRALCDELRKDDFAKDLPDFSPEEIASWAKAFFPDTSPSARILRDLLDVQVEWAARFGRSADFHPALVNACQVRARVFLAASLRAQAFFQLF